MIKIAQQEFILLFMAPHLSGDAKFLSTRIGDARYEPT
jgi:hypothetical protein